MIIQIYLHLSYKLIFLAFDVICVVLCCKEPCQLAQLQSHFVTTLQNLRLELFILIYPYRLSVIDVLKLNIESHRLLLSCLLLSIALHSFQLKL